MIQMIIAHRTNARCSDYASSHVFRTGFPPVRGGFVSAEGDLDFRDTLGVERTAPVGFRNSG
jgi:hypothetical protein